MNSCFRDEFGQLYSKKNLKCGTCHGSLSMIFVPAISTPSQERRGIVLLVVMALLTLFAAVGLSFVFYAEAEATASSFGADAPRKNVPDIDPELLMAYYLGQVLYGVDDANGVYSAMRGHDLARTMYGFQSGVANVNPYNGVGRLHTGGTTGIPSQNNIAGGQDDYFGVNYTYYASDGFKRSPELYSGTYVACNVSYTYPDLNNMFLAAVNGDGVVLAPSFFRPWTGIGSLDPANTNWKTQGNGFAGNAWTKYLTLRPLPAYNPNFPLPEDGGGDVKNFPFGPGTKNPAGGYFNNDSIWMDLGYPVQIAPNGQKYKPLFAALIIDLDGKVNVNVHGNNRGKNAANVAQMAHLSNQGMGPGEVSIRQVLNPTQDLTKDDWVNLLKGNGIRVGRYGFDGQPGTYKTILPPGPGTNLVPAAPPYSMTNLDAAQNLVAGSSIYNSATPYALASKYLVPNETNNTNPPYFTYPFFDPKTYANGDQFERTNIWMIYNFFNPGTTDDTPFGWSEMEALLRYGDTGSPAMSSALFALSPQSFAVARARRLVTTHSFGLGRPGATPWLWATPNAAYNSTALWTAPQGVGPVGFPTPFPTAGPNGEFGSDYRAIVSALGLDLSNRLSLNRFLPDYPKVDFGNPGRWNLATIDLNTGLSYQTLFNNAQGARQQLATDIFNRLCWVSTGGFVNPSGGKSYWYTSGGAAAPGTDINDRTAFTQAQYNALQWLAQLAVNIVDYVDDDSLITPFNWDSSTPNDATSSPNKWVYGTELPRVVVNETYVEVGNDPSDPFTLNVATKPFQVNLWAELLCPLPGNVAQEMLQMPAVATATGSDATYPVYKLAIQTGAAATLADQTLGTPAAAPLVLEVADFTNPANGSGFKIAPLGTAYSGVSGGTTGFFVVGPRVGTLTGQVPREFPGTNVTPPTSSIHVGPIAVTGATNAAGLPITISTANTLGLYNGAKVIISGVQGNTAANNTVATPTWTIANLQANVSFDLVGSTGNGAYTGGGTWVLADYFDSVASSMSYNTLPNTTAVANYPRHNVILRRLACPYLPPNPYVKGVLQYPTLPYNPYITVDYVQNIPANDGVTFDSAGKHTPTLFAGLDGGGNFQGRFSQGRNQPYAATQFMNTAGRPITNITSAVGTPIVVVSNNHGFNTNDKVFITGVVGTTNANNTVANQPWTITKIDANSFTLTQDGTGAASNTNAAYTSGGTAYWADRPQHTLFRHNAIEAAGTVGPLFAPTTAGFFTAAQGQTLKLPFDWLVHMDRFLISPMELLHVSGYPPYLLTQQFMTLPVTNTPPVNQAFQHIAPWTNASSRLYRFFEYVDINSRASGVSNGGRIPGQINVNSIWDIETLMALCDPNATSTFQSADITAIFTAMLNSRTPNGIPGQVGTSNPGNDRPFRSFATGQVPAGDAQNPQGLDIGDTLLRGVFDVPLGSVQANGRSYNPFLVKELLTKISSNLTTRSNTFAVFLTVGFFAVDQDTDAAGNPLLPPVLGAEIGKAEGRNIRHRMFALIDRSELRLMDVDATGQPLTGTSTTGAITPVVITGNFVTQSTPVTATINLSATTVKGSNGVTFTLLPNQTYSLEVDTGSGNEETVSATMNGAGNAFTATFYKNHPATFPIVGRGNPGPATRYNPRNDTRVVPYFSIIE
jgi:hypothetical protein